MIKGIGAGISASISFGHYGGFQIQFNKEFWRIVLGWVAVSICFFDLDFVFGMMLTEKVKEIKGGN